MLKFFKNIKQISTKIVELQKEIDFLKSENLKISSEFNGYLRDKNVYMAIGIPHVECYNKEISLLIEARNRGYFNDNNYFIPIEYNHIDKAYYRHRYSNIGQNYSYCIESDSLWIPGIGNIGRHRVCIYKEGKWAKLKIKKKKINYGRTRI